MKLGSLLGALSPGLSATGLFGNAAQGTGMGMLGAMSPLLMLLMQMKKKKKDDGSAETPPVAAPGQINVTQNPMLRAMGGGAMMLPPGMQAPPFGVGQRQGMY